MLRSVQWIENIEIAMYSDRDNKFNVTLSSQGTPSHFSTRHDLFLLHTQNFHILQCLLTMYSI